MMSRFTLSFLVCMLAGSLLSAGCLESPSEQNSYSNANFDLEKAADQNPPAVVLLYPHGGAIISGEITITAGASDDSGIFCVEFFIDGVKPGNGTEYNDPYECLWETNPLEDQSIHYLYAKATDTSGNTAYSETITVIVDNSNSNSVSVVLNEDITNLQIFPPDNWWNLDISHAPIDPSSASIISWIGTSRRLHPDFGPSPYGIPYIGVSSRQQLRPIYFYAYPSESDAGAPGFPAGYPIPDVAFQQVNYIEGGELGGGDYGDRHMIIIDRDNRLLYETFGTSYNSTTHQWQAACGAAFDLTTNDRRPEGWTSADAAGLAVFPGLVKYDEVYGPEEINHALRFTTRSSNGYVWPASHEAGASWGAPPLGMRIRLKASFDISGYPPPIQKILRAMKRYGMILADNGSDMFMQGTMDSRWDSGVLNDAIHSLHAGDFEVVLLGWQPTISGIPTEPQNSSTMRKDAE